MMREAKAMSKWVGRKAPHRRCASSNTYLVVLCLLHTGTFKGTMLFVGRRSQIISTARNSGSCCAAEKAQQASTVTFEIGLDWTLWTH